MTIESPNTLDTTRAQDGQPDGSITEADIRAIIDSLAGVASPPAKTADYTITLGDRGTCLEMDSTSARQFLIPTDAAVSFDIGTVIEFAQVNTGSVTIAAVTPGTTNIRTSTSTVLRARWSTASIRKRGVDDWLLSGDLS